MGNKIAKQVELLKPWFHNLHLPDGTQTAPDHFLGDFPRFKWHQFCSFIPADLTGLRVLDIGCNAGFYSFELAKRGAQVLAIDLDPHYLKQAIWASKIFGFENKIEFKQMQVYDLAKLQDEFDIIWFMGVFYHLRYPLLALDIVSQKLKKLMVFQTLKMPGKEVLSIAGNYKLNDRKEMLKEGWPKMAFIENKLSNDPTNWWAPNHACIEAMMRTCGLKILHHPLEETYICIPDADKINVSKDWNRSEFLSATGQIWKNTLDSKIGKPEKYIK